MSERAVCTDLAGAFHDFRPDGLEPRGWIDGVYRSLPNGARQASIASDGQSTVMVFQGQVSGAWAVTAAGYTRLLVAKSHGLNAQRVRCLGPDRFLVACVTPTAVERIVLNGRLELVEALTPLKNPPTGNQPYSTGILALDASGAVVWRTEQQPLDLLGQRLTLWSYEPPWYVGQANSGPSGVLVANVEAGQIWRIYTGDNQLPSQIAVSGAQIRVAIPQAPRLYTEADLQPITAEPWPPVEGVPQVRRPLYFGAFAFGAVPVVGNCEVPVKQTVAEIRQRAADRLQVLPWELADEIPPDRLMGIWCGQLDLPDGVVTLEERIAQSRPVADRLGKPLEVYVDSRRYDRAVRNLLRPSDRLWLQCYRNKGEPLSEFEDAVETEILELAEWEQSVVLVVGASDRNGWLTEREILDAMLVCFQQAAAYGDVIAGVVIFAAGRADALPKYPTLVPYVEQFYRSVTGLPPWRDLEDDVNRPGVQITAFDPVLTNRNTWRAHIEDRNNPGHAYDVEFVNGSFHFQITNPAGSDRSGKARPVVIAEAQQ